MKHGKLTLKMTPVNPTIFLPVLN